MNSRNAPLSQSQRAVSAGHEQQKRAVEPEPARRGRGPPREMQQHGDERARVNAGAALAERQEFAAGRPGMRGILASNPAENMAEQFRHDHLTRFFRSGGTGMGTLVTGRFFRLKSTRNKAQSSGLSDSF